MNLQQAQIAAYRQQAEAIEARHRAQTRETVAALKQKYAAPLFGRVSPWWLVEKLGQCIDPSDCRLYGVSQLMHVRQIIAGAEAEGAATDALILAALVHDLGKVLLLAGEAPENVVCFNAPIGDHPPHCGLDNVVMQWNHDEFAYTRLKDHVPDWLAWLIRYHSIDRTACEPYMDARDRAYAEGQLTPFARYDHGTKSPFFLPQRPLEDYRPILERALPPMIVF